ncbi:Vanillin dehydrogenase [Escovopsis weberi]|uniref:Vanillin dehydrogenase n=1 Tax=Escovopsis weberi TaxID=150374 RepID=A0A0M8MQM7_ESCWE|nr:Vanillin dehydrogenase [Escovopsis weberi]
MSFLKGPNGEQVLPVKIDGVAEPIDPSRLIAVQSSITGETMHYAQSATPEMATRAVESSYAAFQQWRKTTHVHRRELLLRAAAAVEAREERFVELQRAETSCTEQWARFNVRLAAQCFREVASSIASVMTGELPPLETEGALCLVYQEPVGPVLSIAPWNAGMIICSRSLAMPIAAGCSVVLKASELCPAVHHLLVETLEDCGLPRGVANVLQAARADAPAVTEAIVAHRAVRKVCFTGSDAVGRIIGQLAASHLKPVLMELGGKAPAIVLADADVKLAARYIALGAMIHHGQICMSTDRIIAVRAVADELITELRAAIQAEFPDGAGHAVTRTAARRAHKLLADAHANGARFLIGDGSLNATGSSLTPTIITDIKEEDDIFHHELFAPAAIFRIVEDEDEAVRVANDTHYGLNAAVHGRDVFATLRVAKQIEAGQVHIGSITQYDEATVPLGGTKGSGWGRNNGKYGLSEFVETKTISIHDPNVVGKANRFGKKH